MWYQLAAAVVGIWLMASPSVLDLDGSARISVLIAGPLAVSVAVVAASEIGRGLRWINVLIGAWLLVSPLIRGFGMSAAINSLVAGALLIAFSLLGCHISGRYGGGWRSLVE
jgi:hypothetical protein